MKKIKNWTIDSFHVERTYGGLMEGDPRSDSVKTSLLSDSFNHVPDWVLEEDNINFFSEETTDGYLKGFTVTFTLTDIMAEKQAVFVVLADEFDSISELINNTLIENPKFKTFNWDF